MKRLCVIGSINMDLVTTMEEFPELGQTVTGNDFAAYPGGKGANQAVAASRLGADVLLVGKLGNDVYGKTNLEVFQENNVNIKTVGIEQQISSGLAIIAVNRLGDNNIVVFPGANGKMDISFIEQNWQDIMQTDIFLLQLEIPLDTVWETIKRLKAAGKTIILDPAPAVLIPREILMQVDFVTPNETELEILSGRKISDALSFQKAALELLEQGAHTVIAKQGKNGASVITREILYQVNGFEVQTVDTTAAGDSFNAGFAFKLAQGEGILECVRFANAVGALATTSLGAQSSMPSLEQVEKLMHTFPG